MNNQDSWIIVGRFGRPHGVKGFITIHSFTDPKDNILGYDDWHVRIKNCWKTIKLLNVEVQNKNIVAQIEGYTDRESVAQLTNVEIAVSKEQLAELKPGEYYWYQLIDMAVINTKGESLGNVIEIIPTGGNDVLVVQGEKRHLIPYLLGQFVLDINDAQKIITVDWDTDF